MPLEDIDYTLHLRWTDANGIIKYAKGTVRNGYSSNGTDSDLYDSDGNCHACIYVDEDVVGNPPIFNLRNY